MAYKINDDCIACGSCADECADNAIFEGDDHFEINQDKCTECGICLDVCPMSAISH